MIVSSETTCLKGGRRLRDGQHDGRTLWCAVLGVNVDHQSVARGLGAVHDQLVVGRADKVACGRNRNNHKRRNEYMRQRGERMENDADESKQAY